MTRGPNTVSRILAGAVVLLVSCAACSSSAGHRTQRTSSTAPAASQSSPSPAADPGSTKSTTPTSKPTTVPSVAVTTAPAVPLRSTASFGNGVAVQITSIAYGKTAGSGPGVIVGQPTVELTLTMTNRSDKTIALNTVQVNLTSGASHTPAVPDAAGTQAFSGELGSGAHASARYSFSLDAANRDSVQLTVWYASGVKTVLLVGSAG